MVLTTQGLGEGVFIGEWVSAITFAPLLVPFLSPPSEGPFPCDLLLVCCQLDSVQGCVRCEHACLHRLVVSYCVLVLFSVHWGPYQDDPYFSMLGAEGSQRPVKEENRILVVIGWHLGLTNSPTTFCQAMKKNATPPAPQVSPQPFQLHQWPAHHNH